jgi:hypothetical protein
LERAEVIRDVYELPSGSKASRVSYAGPHTGGMAACSAIRVRSLIERLSMQEAERDRVVGQILLDTRDPIR